MNYVKRCKNKSGNELHNKRHLAKTDFTYCGKELNEMWFIESSWGISIKDVNCKQCLKVYKGDK
jgi:hypothetical protein